MCLTPGCSHPQLAPWWRLCAGCTLPLIEGTRDRAADQDQAQAAGWDCLTWAERIAPDHWGSAREHDRWVQAQRCLAFLGTVTAHATACQHVAAAQSPLPVVLTARAPDHQACPICAEDLVARNASYPGACDRCGRKPVHRADRCALTTGTSLIIVAQLCADCRVQAFALADDLSTDDLA